MMAETTKSEVRFSLIASNHSGRLYQIGTGVLSFVDDGMTSGDPIGLFTPANMFDADGFAGCKSLRVKKF
jgi:hypothetical protein